jgi:6-phosphogluconolactonase
VRGKFSFSVKFLEELRMLKRAAALLLVCASIALGVSCTTTSSRYVFATLPTSNAIVVYREDPASGGLVQLVGSPVTAGPAVQSLALHPSGKFLYAANSGQNNVSLYSVSAGSLTETAARTPAGTSPTLLAIDSAGAFLYVANAGSSDVSVFSINQTNGTLTPVTQLGSANTASIGLSALNMAVAPSGNVLYVTGQGSTQQGGWIVAFPLTSGVLGSPLTGSPFTTGDNPYGLAIAPGGGFLYTGNKTSSSISEFTINSDGTLTPLANSPISEVYNAPVSLVIDKSGKYLYAANQGNGNLIGYSIGSDGSLTLISTSPFVTGTQPNFVAADPGGGYIFVGYGTSPPALQSFSLDSSTGTLTSVGAYSLTGSGAPTSIVVSP